MQDDRGRVIAATQANLFACIDGAWVTPRLDECGVAGVMRRAFRAWCEEQGTPVVERALEVADVDCCHVPGPDERADRRLAGRNARWPGLCNCPGGACVQRLACAPMNRWLQAAALFAFVAIAVFLVWNHYERQWLQGPIAGLVEPTVFEVPRGASLTSVARRLEQAGLMERPSSWLRHATREGLATRLKAGEYRLQPGTSPEMLLDQFVAGDVILHAVTLPEGWTFRQALAAIQSHPQVTAELKGLDDASILARLGLRDSHPEGLFFPDTYRFPRGTSDREIMRQAHARLESELAAAWSRRAAGLATRNAIRGAHPRFARREGNGRCRRAAADCGRVRQSIEKRHAPADRSLRHLRPRRPDSTATCAAGTSRATPPTTPTRALACRRRRSHSPGARRSRRPSGHRRRMRSTSSPPGSATAATCFADSLAAHNANVSRHIANLRRGRGVRVR